MIQRIQTLHLLVIVILMTLVTLMPIVNFTTLGESFVLKIFGVISKEGAYIVKTPFMGIAAILCLAIPLVTIFLYKRRILQIRLCVVEMVLLAGLQLFMIMYLFRTHSTLEYGMKHLVKYSFTVILPLISIILAYFAYRSILKDEIIIASERRLR